MGAPPHRSDDQTGGSVAFARALRPDAAVDGEDLVVDGKKYPLDLTPRDQIRRLLGVRRPGRPLTADDIRGICLQLPEAVERVKTRRDGTTAIHFVVAGTMFVKMFEAGNLLRPDLDDVVLIRKCPDRAALLQAAADRFFVPRPYAPHVGGPVLTRLSENSRRHLPELAELITESWRAVAPKRAIRAHDATA
jgi:hypothetical protein